VISAALPVSAAFGFVEIECDYERNLPGPLNHAALSPTETPLQGRPGLIRGGSLRTAGGSESNSWRGANAPGFGIQCRQREMARAVILKAPEVSDSFAAAGLGSAPT